MLREGVKCKKKNKKNIGGPSIPQIGNIHRVPKLQITKKSIYRAKKLTPAVILHRLESNRVNIMIINSGWVGGWWYGSDQQDILIW